MPYSITYVIENMQKATSAYAKNEDPKTGETAVEFLEKSEVMFLNEKRTARLLRSMGLLTPIELSQSGSIGSIEYIGRKVKLKLYYGLKMPYSITHTVAQTGVWESYT